MADGQTTNFPTFGIFRVKGQWVLAWGYPAGKDTLEAAVQTTISDQALRVFYSALHVLVSQEKTLSEPISLPFLTQLTVTRQGLLDTWKKVERMIQLLDSGKDIPESNVFEGGSRN